MFRNPAITIWELLRNVGQAPTRMARRDSQMAFPATVHVYFDNVNSESYQTFLAYLDRLQYKYDVEMGKSIDVRRSMKRRTVTGEPRIITDEME
jgi:hypothetical protein